MTRILKALLGSTAMVLAGGCSTRGLGRAAEVVRISGKDVVRIYGTDSPVRKELPVYIKAIDGESTIYGSTPMRPGRHVVDVYLGTRVGPYSKQVRQLEIDADACTRYRIVAGYQNLTHIEWTPVIYREPIGECPGALRGRS